MDLFLKTICYVCLARLREFYRDRAVLGWSIFLPFFVILSFYFLFNEDKSSYFKIGVAGSADLVHHLGDFSKLEYIQFVQQAEPEGIEKVKNHKLDMLIQLKEGQPVQYWVHSASKKGYFLEKIFRSSYNGGWQKRSIPGKWISYIQWVFPGIIALNLMFSCLWGIGWVIVKYRDGGYLKRLNVTPLKAHHFIIGQVMARFIIVFFLTAVIYIVGSLLIDFKMQGSYLNLFVCYFLGALSLISMGLLVATRTTSKEFADGLLNVISWPMMIFSGMWFSIEGMGPWIKGFAYIFPLTHLIESTRRVMLEGADLAQVSFNLMYMALFSVILFCIISLFFKWSEK